MPSYCCKHGTCTNYLPRPGYCNEHIHLAPADRRDYHKKYDQERRDPRAKKFYSSAEWLNARRIKLSANPTCEICNRFAQMVHHKIPLSDPEKGWKLRVTQSNLMSLCNPCHGTIEAEVGGL